MNPPFTPIKNMSSSSSMSISSNESASSSSNEEVLREEEICTECSLQTHSDGAVHVDQIVATHGRNIDVETSHCVHVQLIEKYEQEQNRMMSELKRSAVGMEIGLNKMKHENLTLSSQLTELQATDATGKARLSEMEKQLATSENERITFEGANYSLRARLESVNSEKLQLETKLHRTDTTAKEAILELENELLQSRNNCNDLEASNNSLRSELAVVNSEKKQVELSLQANATASKASLLELERKFIQSGNDRNDLEAANNSLRSELAVVKSEKRQLELTLQANATANKSNLLELEKQLIQSENDRKVIEASLRSELDLVTSKKRRIVRDKKKECEALSKSKSHYKELCKRLTKALNDMKSEGAAKR